MLRYAQHDEKIDMYDVIIIGAGLGGLECGYILSKNGMNVCIVERERELGGCIQSFKRGKSSFDTGFHYIGALDEGESLHRLFTYLNLMDLPWVRLDDDFDHVILNSQEYIFRSGHEAFFEEMCSRFSHQRENLRKYVNTLKKVGDNIFDSLNPKSHDEFFSTSLFGVSAKAFLNETISDPLLRDVLCGTSMKLELAEKLPLYTFAQINDSFLRGAYRLDGGGSQIADHLASDILSMGGTIIKGTDVTSIKINAEGLASGVELSNGEIIEAKWFISNAHPAHTVRLIEDTPYLKNIYRSRITRLENTTGYFTANIKLKGNTIPYLNHNLFIYENADLWSYTQGVTDRTLVSYYKPNLKEGACSGYCQSIDLLTPMDWNEVEKWKDTGVGHRGDDYVEMKNRKADECISIAERHIPNLREAIDHIYTSTPLSYYSYTNTENGSAYGIRKDFESPMTTVLTPKTPIKNLLLTGQNLNLHGVLGVSMTALFTVKEILNGKIRDLVTY